MNLTLLTGLSTCLNDALTRVVGHGGSPPPERGSTLAALLALLVAYTLVACSSRTGSEAPSATHSAVVDSLRQLAEDPSTAERAPLRLNCEAQGQEPRVGRPLRFEPRLRFTGQEAESVVVGEPAVKVEGYLEGRRIYPSPDVVYTDVGYAYEAQPGQVLPLWGSRDGALHRDLFAVELERPGRYAFVCKAWVELRDRPGHPTYVLHSTPMEYVVR